MLQPLAHKLSVAPRSRACAVASKRLEAAAQLELVIVACRYKERLTQHRLWERPRLSADRHFPDQMLVVEDAEGLHAGASTPDKSANMRVVKEVTARGLVVVDRVASSKRTAVGMASEHRLHVLLSWTRE